MQRSDCTSHIIDCQRSAGCKQRLALTPADKQTPLQNSKLRLNILVSLQVMHVVFHVIVVLVLAKWFAGHIFVSQHMLDIAVHPGTPLPKQQSSHIQSHL
jgi:hypothetical protein